MQDVDTGRGTEKMWVLVTWTWKAGAAGAVCGHPATHTGRPQGEKNRPAMEPERGCGDVESMGIWRLKAMQNSKVRRTRGEMWQNCEE